MAKTLKVNIQIAPLKGRAQNKTVTVPASATAEEVCVAAGVDPDRKDITVDGKPATLSTRVTEDSKVRVVEMKVAERPQGS